MLLATTPIQGPENAPLGVDRLTCRFRFFSELCEIPRKETWITIKMLLLYIVLCSLNDTSYNSRYSLGIQHQRHTPRNRDTVSPHGRTSILVSSQVDGTAVAPITIRAAGGVNNAVLRGAGSSARMLEIKHDYYVIEVKLLLLCLRKKNTPCDTSLLLCR